MNLPREIRDIYCRLTDLVLQFPIPLPIMGEDDEVLEYKEVAY